MDEIWEKAVETALDGEMDHASARTLTLDGAVKCIQGRLPPPSFLERFQNLEHFSIANIGVSSLEQFPRLRNLQKLILSDNRIAGGLEFLVQAGLHSLRDLDLSNNRIQFIEDLAPLAQLKLVSLDLYECPVTRVKDYRSRVFGLINSLKYLDKMDMEENERPESDDEDEEEEEEDDDPGSGEIDGEDRPHAMSNGHGERVDGVVDVDEEESDADEEEVEISRRINGFNHGQNGSHVQSLEWDNEGKDDEEEEEIDEDEGDDEDDDVVEVHEIDDSDDDEDDGVDFDEDDDDDEEEDVDNDEGEFAEPESTELLVSTEGEIDGHEQGEEDGDEDDNGETGEEELGVEFGESGDDDDDEEEDYGAGYLVQPVGQPEAVNAGAAPSNGEIEEDEEEEEEGDDEELEDEEEVDDDDEEEEVLPPTSSNHKRKRDGDEDDDSDEQ
ncbi:PREDICTED: acidic leucine-rich nuclear phosphoprotein 32-related protein-like [Lupinus angustifolius]|uniref:acidic leucine-rich nuclear phosphoprotein 32-related protein-like n=1 Tax=Lupinus angustifolius TaxID=3871 RepID=UPI00092F8280|nr:PREDICTED: acidic leucine-rich nuclear phosphoprotein 32-related protein-like [Lupinus angustifolius]